MLQYSWQFLSNCGGKKKINKKKSLVVNIGFFCPCGQGGMHSFFQGTISKHSLSKAVFFITPQPVAGFNHPCGTSPVKIWNELYARASPSLCTLPGCCLQGQMDRTSFGEAVSHRSAGFSEGTPLDLLYSSVGIPLFPLWCGATTRGLTRARQTGRSLSKIP